VTFLSSLGLCRSLTSRRFSGRFLLGRRRGFRSGSRRSGRRGGSSRQADRRRFFPLAIGCFGWFLGTSLLKNDYIHNILNLHNLVDILEIVIHKI